MLADAWSGFSLTFSCPHQRTKQKNS